jgi:hypothetical protein
MGETFAIPCNFIRTVARAVLIAKFITGGKDEWAMAHPKGFR